MNQTTKTTVYVLSWADYTLQANGKFEFACKCSNECNKVSFDKTELLEKLREHSYLAHIENRGWFRMDENGKITNDALTVYNSRKDLKRVFQITEHEITF